MQRTEFKVAESEIVFQTNSIVEKRHTCQKCDRPFDKPKLVQYYACPHCLAKIEDGQRTGCRYWFGYLHQKEAADPMPNECVECDKVVECMLNQTCSSAMAEIKKWY